VIIWKTGGMWTGIGLGGEDEAYEVDISTCDDIIHNKHIVAYEACISRGFGVVVAYERVICIRSHGKSYTFLVREVIS